MLKRLLAVVFVLTIALGVPTAALATGTVTGHCNALAGNGNSESDVCVFVIAGGGGGEGRGFVEVTNYTDNPAGVGVFHESLGSSELGGRAVNCLTNPTGDRYDCNVGGSAS